MYVARVDPFRDMRRILMEAMADDARRQAHTNHGGNGGRMHDRMERMPTRRLPADATVVAPPPSPPPAPPPPPPSDAPQGGGSGSAKGYGAATRAHWDLMDTIPNRQLSVGDQATPAAHKDKLMYTRMGPSWPIRDRQLMVNAAGELSVSAYTKPQQQQQHAIKAGERMRKNDSGYALQERQLAADAHVVPPRSAADADRGGAKADAAEDGMAAPRLHRHKVVRDLAWSLASPNLMSRHCEGLLEGGRVWLDEGAALVAASREWLEGLDDDPGPLLAWLRQQHGINRLGHYFSALIEYWIRHCMGVDPAFMVCRKQVGC